MLARRLAALQSLRCAIDDAVPGLPICPWPTPPNHNLMFPSLALVPVRWTYVPSQETLQEKRTPSTVIIELGKDEVLIQLRLVHATPVQRAEIEEKILDVFAQREGAPGVLVTVVNSIPDFGEWTCSWELEEEEWDDGKAFDNEFWSVITLTGHVPKLTCRKVPDIRDLQIGLNTGAEMDGTFDDADTTRVRVNEDGTITTLP